MQREQEWMQQQLQAVGSACELTGFGSRADTHVLDGCYDHVLQLFAISTDEAVAREQITDTCVGRMRGLGSTVRYANSTRGVCWATPGMNVTSWACEALSTVTWEVLAIALRLLAICSIAAEAMPEHQLEAMADESFSMIGQAFQMEIDLHAETPLGPLIVKRLSEAREDFMDTLSPSSHARQLVSRTLALSKRIGEHTNHLIWRDSHYLWLTDSIRRGEVMHTTWGPVENWDELGANDARSRHPLAGGMAGAPAFVFSDTPGQRREILVSLLRKLYEARGASDSEKLAVVEVGVFRAGLSQYLLETLPFIRLLGVDPYIGTDGTFPGDFSETLNPDDALAVASGVFNSFGDRAELLPETSEQAAQKIPDGSLDAVFVDGCHLYECVETDLEVWIPKLRPGGQALLAGHDFSPQWPGVVRAVHERRLGGQRVFLGQDWMYWWYPN